MSCFVMAGNCGGTRLSTGRIVMNTYYREYYKKIKPFFAARER